MYRSKLPMMIPLLLVVLALLLRNTVANASSSLHCGAWSVVKSPNRAGSNYNTLSGVVSLSAHDVWAVGYATGPSGTTSTLTEQWNGSTWTVVSSPNAGLNGSWLYGATAISAQNIWAVGLSKTNNVLNVLTERWNGKQWQVVPSPSPQSSTDDTFRGVAAIAPSDVWAVGDYSNSSGIWTLIEHWNGTKWKVIPSPNPTQHFNVLSGVTAITANDVWAVGFSQLLSGTTQTLIEHWDGTSWSIVKSPNRAGSNYSALSGVASISAHDVWAVGSAMDPSGYSSLTLTEQWNGSTWTLVSSPNTGIESDLTAVTLSSASSAWAVGQTLTSLGGQYQALILNWNGTNWSIVPSPGLRGDSFLSGVTLVPGSSKTWAVGEDEPAINEGSTLTEFYC